MEAIDVEKIKKEFVEIASKHLLYTLNGDYKNANKLQTKFLKIYNKVNKFHRQGLFEDLLNHDNEGVRLWAATASLKTNPEVAVSCLNKLISLPSITSMDAKMTLDLWEKGELELL